MNIQQQPLPICFATNHAYLQHFMVALVSLLKNNTGKHFIFILHDDLSLNDLDLIERTAKKFSPETTIEGIKIDESKLPQLTGSEQRLGKASLHRILIPDVLPKMFKYAFYLDADIVIQSKIEWPDLPLEDFTLFAVKDPSSELFAPKRNLKKMFNSGVLLINLKKWKIEQTLSKLRAYNPPISRLADQEILNGVFADAWYELPETFNSNAIYLKRKNNSYINQQGIAPYIIHFMGMHKPWLYFTNGSLIYWQYILQTPFLFSAFKIPVTMVNRVILGLRYKIKLFMKNRGK